MTFSYTSDSAIKTQSVAKQLANLLFPGATILLDGDLGAGKTTFTKGLAEGLEIKRPIKSPTFTIIREYPEGKIPLYHMDAYRLEESPDENLGLSEYFDGQGISVVEWSQFIEEDLPDDVLRIKIDKDENDDNKRLITFEPTGQRYENVVSLLEEKYQ